MWALAVPCRAAMSGEILLHVHVLLLRKLLVMDQPWREHHRLVLLHVVVLFVVAVHSMGMACHLLWLCYRLIHVAPTGH